MLEKINYGPNLDSIGSVQAEKQTFGSKLNDYIQRKQTSPNLKKLKKKVQVIRQTRENYKEVHDLSFFRRAFQQRLQEGETLEEILPEAYAVVLEAISRTKKGANGQPIELTDSQIITSLVLNDGDIAELATGEGKTFALTLAAYLNTLNGDQVHVFTANDYLAQRDAEINTPIFESLGLHVGCALSEYEIDGIALDKNESKKMRRKAYQDCDIVYAQASTIVFDWEFDQQVMKEDDQVLNRPFNYAIVDEVDSVLIDDANTPLIISQSLKSYEEKLQSEEDSNLYSRGVFNEETRQKCITLANDIVTALRLRAKNTFRVTEGISKNPLYNKITVHNRHLPGTQARIHEKVNEEGYCILVDERSRIVELTDVGYQKIGNFIADLPYDENDIFLYIQNALYAHCILTKNVDYRVAIDSKTGNKKIVLIDANTGRDLPDSKLSDGLQQALEIKEGIPFNNLSTINISTAKITHPGFFAKYKKMAGTSGTVSDEVTKREFKEQYNKKIIEIPRSKSKIAIEKPIEVYATKKEKFNAILNQIIECNQRQQPILVGARDIEEAKEIIEYLKPYEKRPFDQLCCQVFQTDKKKINIFKATKLYCLMTNTCLPKDRSTLNAMARQIQSLILPENEKSPLDYRMGRMLQAKLDSINSISIEAQEELFDFVHGTSPESIKEAQNFYTRLRGLSFQSLTAENTEHEAEIISKAGQLGAITIATAIAGRGTDIALGGDAKELARYDTERFFVERLKKKLLNSREETSEIANIRRQTEMLSHIGRCDFPEIQQFFERKLIKWQEICDNAHSFLQSHLQDSYGNFTHEPGKGLYVLGASLNDSTRIDNQLRGRCGRQGSDGESKFVCSLEDPLIQQNGNERKFNSIKSLVSSNPSNRSAIQYVKAAQRSKESIRSSIREDINRCANGFNWITNSYYSYRERLLKDSKSLLPNIFQTTATLLFDHSSGVDTNGCISYFIPTILSDDEVNTLSSQELKDLFEKRTSMLAIKMIENTSKDFDNELKTKLLTAGDLKFTALTDGKAIERQLSLERLVPNQSTSLEVLLDQIVYNQYNEFRAEVILESAVIATKLFTSYLKTEEDSISVEPSVEDIITMGNSLENISAETINYEVDSPSKRR